MLLRLRREETEHGWAEEHSRNHLADDLCLSQGAQQAANQTAGREDDGKLEEEMYGKLKSAAHARKLSNLCGYQFTTQFTQYEISLFS